MNIELEGLDEVFDSLDSLVDETKLKKAMQKCCAIVERSAKEKAPKDTGALRRSITSRVDSAGLDIEGVVYTPLEYAVYVEMGTGLFAENGGRTDVPWCYQDDKGEWHSTSGMHPHPYMRPALYENRDKIIQTLKEGVLQND